MKYNTDNVKIVVPWHNQNQLACFTDAWGVSTSDPRFVFQQDAEKLGCAVTKNRGINHASKTAQWVIVLDDDCYPDGDMTVRNLINGHLESLQPKRMQMYWQVTDPPSRGTPFSERDIEFPVAASMGFWSHVGDYDAPSQLVHGATKEMEFYQEPIFGRHFSLCGMNLAFDPHLWWPWWQFIDVPRFDDIWSGLLLQKEAYRRGYCFSLSGPTVRHSRQSNVWKNLRDEAKYLEANETLWRDIFLSKETSYEELIKLLPCNKSIS